MTADTQGPLVGRISEEILNALPLAAVLIGQDARLLAVNPAAQEVFPAAAPGRHHVSALRQPGLLAAIAQCRATGEPQNLRVELPSDHVFRATVAAAALLGGRAVLVSFEDLSTIDKALRSRREFVANLGHELRTPLTAILSFTDTLRGAARDDAAANAHFLDLLHGEVTRMAALVSELATLDRIEADEARLPLTLIDLCAELAGAAETLRPLVVTTGAQLMLDLPQGPLMAPADAGQIRQVVANLIENALKYGAGGGTVTLSLARDGGFAQISVQDEGDGIAPEHIARLTERFYRIDDHRARNTGGSGLGLAIVKHIVQRHRGRLRIESTQGEGSRFTVILPLDEG